MLKTVLTDGQWHVQCPLVSKDGNVTLNARLFEESVLDSIRMDASDNRSWATRTEAMNNALAKLKMLGTNQFNPLSAKGRVAIRDIFHNMLNAIRTQQSRIGEIFREHEAASSRSEIREDAFLDEIKNAKEALDAMEEQVDKLIDMTLITPIGVRLREQAHHLRKLDSLHEAIEKSNEKEFLDSLKAGSENGVVKSKAEVALETISEAFSWDMEQTQSSLSPERKQMIMKSMTGRLANSEEKENQSWGMKLKEQNAERIKVSNQITDLFSEAAEAGIDLSNELSTDEIVYLTRAMGMDTNKRLGERGLTGGDLKDIQYVDEKFTRKTIAVTKLETDKLARQNADLLHEPQLQSLLTRLNEQEAHLDQLIALPLQSGSTKDLSTGVENIHDALKRMDKSEVSRLCNHNEVKGQGAKSRIGEQLDRLGTKVQALHNAILRALDAPGTNSLTDEDRRQLKQAAKLLEYAQSEANSLMKTAAPSTQRARRWSPMALFRRARTSRPAS